MIHMKKDEILPEIVVGAYIKNDSDEFLFVKSKYEKKIWTVPGGHVERGERIADALRRTVFEETGLVVNPIRLLGIQEKIPGRSSKKDNIHFIFMDFLCEIKSKKRKPRISEVKSSEWIGKPKLKKLKVDRYTRYTIKMLGMKGTYEPYIPLGLEKKLLTK